MNNISFTGKENIIQALIKGRETRKHNTEERKKEFNKLCPTCNSNIKWEQKLNTFCSRSCAATHTNKERSLDENMRTKIQLAGEVSGKIRGEKCKILREEYQKNPKLCQNCNVPLSYENKRHNCCSHSCGTKFGRLKNRISPKLAFSYVNNYENFVNIKTNLGERTRVTVYCICCKREIELNRPSAHQKYCSLSCQQYFQMLKRIEKNRCSSRTIKNYLIKKGGHKCSCCGLSDWNNQPISLELEHIDGNSQNNNLDNCILCPNCHSQTPTYKGKNKGNGRHSRKMRYREGKSY